MAEYNEHHPQKISLADGSASKTEESTDMTALFKAADKNMYDQKIRMLKRIKEEDV